MPAYELYLVYFAVSFAAGTRVNCQSLMFKDDLKTSEQQLSGRLRRVFIISGGEEKL